MKKCTYFEMSCDYETPINHGFNHGYKDIA
jgi:hypothetical protein